MDDLRILGTKPVPKLIDDMSISEQIDFIQNEYTAKEDMLSSCYEMEKTCTSYMNQSATIECRKMIPKDPLWVRYSLEAWTLNESLKKVLQRFEEYFPKVYNYIQGFVILRVKSSIMTCEKWVNIISDTNKNQEKIDKIFQDSTVKTAKVEFVTEMLLKASACYTELLNHANNLKGFKSVGESDADKKKLEELTVMPESYNTYLEKKKLVDDAQPSQKEGNPQTTGFTYRDGGWDDPSKIANLIEAMKKVTSTLESIKRLQAITNDMVKELKKEQKGESADKNLIKDLNDQKIKFLKEFSKNILSGMMKDIGDVTSMSAQNCKSFANKYESE